MATTDELIVKIRAETADLRKGLARVNKTLDRTSAKAKTASTAMKGMTRILALIGVAAVGKGIVNTIRMFEDLEATVQANTRSLYETAQAMKMIREFTAKTTFQVQEVTAAFIEFRRLGIKPTEEQLRGIGNVAAAQGRGIEEVASAIFKAGTTSIEGLQQLGATVVTDGDKLTITIAGVTETIDKNTDSVLKFIAKVGNTKFDTAISDRAKTLSGAISNLGDASAEAAVQIGEGGLTIALVSLTKAMQSSVQGGDGAFKLLGKALGYILLTIQEIVASIAFLKDMLDLGIASAVKTLQTNVLTLFKDLSNIPLIGKFFDVEAAEDNARKAVEAALKAQKDAKESSDELTKVKDAKSAVGDTNKYGPELGMTATRKLGVTGDAGRSTFIKGIKATSAEIKTITGVFDSMADSITSTTAAFTDKFVTGLMEGKGALAGFASFAKDIVKQIISTFIQMAIVNKILNSVFSLSGTTGELATFGRAGGGTVQAGQPTLVGERGAEIFVPNSSGRIMNNADSQGAGGGGVVINQNINFSTGVVGQVRSELAKLMPQISDTTKAAVLEASQRGGSFRKGLMGA
jgi:hypothetical protein